MALPVANDEPIAAAARVVVPLVPTEAMIVAGHMAGRRPEAIWAAMIAAAPQSVPVQVEALRATRRQLATPSTSGLPPETLAVLPALGRVHRNPDFWGDLEVRKLVVELHRQVTIARAREVISSCVGIERTPSKSALDRAWQRLDLHFKRNGVR